MTPHTVGLFSALTEAYLPINSSGKIASYTALCLFTETYEALLIVYTLFFLNRQEAGLASEV